MRSPFVGHLRARRGCSAPAGRASPTAASAGSGSAGISPPPGLPGVCSGSQPPSTRHGSGSPASLRGGAGGVRGVDAGWGRSSVADHVSHDQFRPPKRSAPDIRPSSTTGGPAPPRATDDPATMHFDFADLLLEVLERRRPTSTSPRAPPPAPHPWPPGPARGLPRLSSAGHPRGHLLDPDERSAPAARDRLAARLRLLDPGVARFRVNTYFQRGTHRRRLPPDPARDQEASTSSACRPSATSSRTSRAASCSSLPDGLGQVDSLAAIIDEINRTRPRSHPHRSRTRSSSCTRTRTAWSTSARSARTPSRSMLRPQGRSPSRTRT